jgi:hypothetical protein
MVCHGPAFSLKIQYPFTFERAAIHALRSVRSVGPVMLAFFEFGTHGTATGASLFQRTPMITET